MTRVARAVQLLGAFALFHTHYVSAQVPSFRPVARESNALYRQIVEEEGQHLDDQLQNHPDLEDTFFPEKFQIPTNFYREEDPDGYIMSVIFDPCRGHDFNCCNDTYGTPEFREVVDSPTQTDIHGTDRLTLQDGSLMDTDEASRRPTDAQVIDESCTGVNEPDVLCLGERIRRVDFPITPFCWNHRDTVISKQSCRSPADGSTLPLCLELGFTQTAYIVECGGNFREDDHCGTFLEIHRVGGKDPEGILAQTKLRGQFPSGYRMTVISTTYQGNSSRVLCEGDYEIWWVLRTRYDWVIQRKSPFTVVTPRCDWDPVNNEYLEYATTELAEDIFALDPHNPDNFLFSRPAITGEPGYPGQGMGSTLILPTEDVPASTTGGELPGINAAPGEYEPDRPTVDEFRAEHPDVPISDEGLPIRARPSPLP